ncbi:MAG: hypothetical protein ACRD0S_01170, partial [Acidimicrobiales bacterium]
AARSRGAPGSGVTTMWRSFEAAAPWGAAGGRDLALPPAPSGPPPAPDPTPVAAGAATPADVQRAEEEVAAPTAAPDSPPTAGPPAATGTVPAGAGGGAPPTPEQLDELARRLYDKLRWRLKAELTLDRERAGLLTDLRR